MKQKLECYKIRTGNCCMEKSCLLCVKAIILTWWDENIIGLGILCKYIYIDDTY